MGNFDYYEKAEELSIELKKEGLDKQAIELTNAIEEGSTGTEIFMALRWTIHKFLYSENLNYSSSIKDKATLLFEKLNEALKD